MNVRAALREGLEQLSAAQVPSASTTAEVLLLYVLEQDRTFLYAHPEAQLTLEQERAYRHLVRERAAGNPTQYLTGRQEFWGLSFRVEPSVFIPRPETEHVVEVALDIARHQLASPGARIVDVGTGTGCIALALASELPLAEIFATDISPHALAVAHRNAEELGFANRVRFIEADLLEVFLAPNHELSVTSHGSTLAHSSTVAHHPERESRDELRSFDLVVSNPPYVSPEEAEQLPREVRVYEPAAALFSPGQGLAVTRRLIDQAALLLSGSTSSETRVAGPGPRVTTSQPAAGGWLVLELGYNLASRVRALLGDGWTNVETTNDLRGIPRVLAAQRR